MYGVYGTLFLSPPQKKAVPRTRSMLDRMEPRRDSWTSLKSPLDRAVIATISSVAFPNDAFNNPPDIGVRDVQVYYEGLEDSIGGIGDSMGGTYRIVRMKSQLFCNKTESFSERTYCKEREDKRQHVTSTHKPADQSHRNTNKEKVHRTGHKKSMSTRKERWLRLVFDFFLFEARHPRERWRNSHFPPLCLLLDPQRDGRWSSILSQLATVAGQMKRTLTLGPE